MGSFYTSLTVRGAKHDQVVEAMRGRKAVISPTRNGFTTIWDAECESQDDKVLHREAQRLASTVGSPVWAVLNHDDDILWYSLYSPDGKLDEYNSAPGYFEGDNRPPSGGNARLLSETLAPGTPEDVIETILRGGDYVFENERHFALVRALGIPAFAAGVGHDYIADGELPEGLAKEELTYTD